MKKVIKTVTAVMVILLLLSSCAAQKDKVYLFCREEGSGTRKVFVDTFDILKDEVDNVDDNADITNSSAVMMQAVSGNKNAIGFVSFATLNDKVKSISINGVPAKQEYVKNGEYPLTREFTISYSSTDGDEKLRDFVSFLHSRQSVQIIEEMGYFTNRETTIYKAEQNLKGKLVISGSASVSPLMDNLRLAYSKLQPDMEIEIQQNDSTTGLLLLKQGLTDIAMSSRPVKSEELEDGCQTTVLAQDAIAVIVHPENIISNLTAEQIRKLYSGEITEWDAL